MNGSEQLADGPRRADEAPDTLDLAERGRMAINGILGSLNPDLGYECTFLTLFDVHPAYMLHWSSMVSGCLLYTSPSPRDRTRSRMPSSA